MASKTLIPAHAVPYQQAILMGHDNHENRISMLRNWLAPQAIPWANAKRTLRPMKVPRPARTAMTMASTTQY